MNILKIRKSDQNMDYGINFEFDSLTDLDERAKNIKEAGFTHTFLWRSRDKDGREQLIAQAEAARKAGLTIETVHASYIGVNNMWRLWVFRRNIFNFFKQSILDTAEINVPIMVIHVSSGDFPPFRSMIGLSAFRKLCEFAKEHNVILAFENLRKKRYLAYIMDNIKLDSVKFCFDCGHENVYDGGYGILEKYREKLVCVHLHDNFGKSDNHMIPFDANIDFSKIAERLKNSPRIPVTLELVHCNCRCDDLDEKAFLSKAFKAAKKIGDMIGDR